MCAAYMCSVISVSCTTHTAARQSSVDLNSWTSCNPLVRAIALQLVWKLGRTSNILFTSTHTHTHWCPLLHSENSQTLSSLHFLPSFHLCFISDLRVLFSPSLISKVCALLWEGNVNLSNDRVEGVCHYMCTEGKEKVSPLFGLQMGDENMSCHDESMCWEWDRVLTGAVRPMHKQMLFTILSV